MNYRFRDGVADRFDAGVRRGNNSLDKHMIAVLSSRGDDGRKHSGG